MPAARNKPRSEGRRNKFELIAIKSTSNLKRAQSEKIVSLNVTKECFASAIFKSAALVIASKPLLQKVKNTQRNGNA